MYSDIVKNIYLLGHGRRHGFKLNDSEMINYCEYKDCSKNFVYQLHCNDKYGCSLIDYVVPKFNKKKCLNNYEVTTEFKINKLFLQKIKKIKKINFYDLIICYSLYIFLILSFIIWIFLLYLLFYPILL
ncbi:MAG: hypothetical protein PHR26_04130 [Candidatus ainarchaeum sp.]|nr:hypothetical protein [Candidatus ainarchaeum sp.]